MDCPVFWGAAFCAARTPTASKKQTESLIVLRTPPWCLRQSQDRCAPPYKQGLIRFVFVECPTCRGLSGIPNRPPREKAGCKVGAGVKHARHDLPGTIDTGGPL